MFRELGQDVIVELFKRELPSMKFVPRSDRLNIEQNLDILIRHEEKRFRKTTAAIWLWEYFLEKSLRDISDNPRGLRQLYRYFRDFTEYEDMLFAVDRRHRDHVIHSVWVMLLGVYLIKTFPAFRRFSYPHVQGTPSKGKLGANIKKTIDIIRGHQTSIWCLISLTHDLGYPIQKTKNANLAMEKMINNFGFLARKDFDYSFTIVHQTAISELLNTLSSIVFWNPSGGFTIEHTLGTRLEFARSFEQLDHGIMSAYLLQSYLDFICDIHQDITMCYLPGVTFKDYNVAANYAMVATWLFSIARHTTKNAYACDLNDLDVLLVISDELDEFSRYSRSKSTQDWIEVGCRTECECTKHSLNIKHTFDNTDVAEDMESFFKSKIDRLSNLFELQAGRIQKVSIVCKDVRKTPNQVLIWEKTLSTGYMGVVTKKPGDKRIDDVEKFLSGSIML